MRGRGRNNNTNRGWEAARGSGRAVDPGTIRTSRAGSVKTQNNGNNNSSLTSPGRGHSRGRGRGATALQGSSSRSQASDAPKSERKYEEACAQIQASVNKYLMEHPVEEDDSSDEEEVSQDLQEGLLARVLAGASEGETTATLTHLKDALSSGALTCLICIHAVRRADQTWSCSVCYSVLHLDCVKKWADDSIFLRAERERQHQPHQQRVDHASLKWSCPKCRQQYPQKDIPRHYKCYCGKTYDPPVDPWVLPHSCGETCGRPLQPPCGHACLMLCHPGPCAPCPVMVSTACECGQSGPAPHRCSHKSWTCGKPCRKPLSCGHHRCEKSCHSGTCPPCPRTSTQSCLCGASQQRRPCNDPSWSCDKVCGRPFSCGHHRCTKVCHAPGGCAVQCPVAAAPRYCPCGKTPQPPDLPCHVSVSVCGDTCDKLLACGEHRCAERCHTGACSTCLGYSEKQCRCGSRSKLVQCGKELTCDTKCKRLRDCRKHPCNKKCCTGDCPPCEHPCGKTLPCGNHKCSSRCHTGPCFPCNVTVQVKCACGGSTKAVACGRERHSKPPHCTLPCPQRHKCHHPSQPPHRCHSGECPACKQVCGVRLSDCHHTCPAVCHDSVAVWLVDQRKRAGPWEPVAAPRLEKKKMPCPPCKELVPVVCRGLHSVQDFVCSEARHYSCGRTCGRLLQCSNHACELDCHFLVGDANNGDLLNKNDKRLSEVEAQRKVAKASTAPGENCPPCERVCEKAPVAGCSHPCEGQCHPGSCPPCAVKLRFRCHCGLLMLYKTCKEWTDVAEKDREAAKSCGNRCYKLMKCGHQCLLKCHSGACTDVSACPDRVTIKCPCGRRRKELPCPEAFAVPESSADQTVVVKPGKDKVKNNGNNNNAVVVTAASVLPCDQICREKKVAPLKAKSAEQLRQQQLREEELRKEAENFERKMGGKKGKARKQAIEQAENKSIWEEYKNPLIVMVFGGALAAVVAVVVFWT